MIARLLFLTAVFAALTTLAAHTAADRLRRNPPAVTCSTTWSAPRHLRLGAGHVHVELPQIVATRGGTVLLGDNAVAVAATDGGFVPVAGRPRGAGKLAGFRLGPGDEVAPLPAPPGVGAMIHVHAIGLDGVAHVFWGGSDDTSSMQFQQINALWYARFDGVSWTPPELVVREPLPLLVTASTALIRAGDRVHLMIPSPPPESRGVLHVVRDREGRGETRRHDLTAGYVALAAEGAENLVLATVTPTPGARTHLAVRRSTDGGRTWGDALVLFAERPVTVYDPQLLRAATGLYATWIPSIGSGPWQTETVLVARSRDGGRSWTRLPPVGAGPAVRDPRLARGPDGALHLAIHANDASGGAVIVTELRDSTWGPRVIFGPTPFAAVLATPVPDSQYLAWTEWLHAGPERVPALLVSRRALCPGTAAPR